MDTVTTEIDIPVQREEEAEDPSAAPTSPWLSDELWATIQDSVPIVCVDVVPVRKDESGRVVQVGMIRRFAPFRNGMTWCHVGGRVNLHESLSEALKRHVAETLGVDVDFGVDPQPLHVMQYFRTKDEREGLSSGWDPRKHAVALSYILELPETVKAVEGGEGLEFTWINVEQLAAMKDTWPGTMTMVKRVLAADAALS